MLLPNFFALKITRELLKVFFLSFQKLRLRTLFPVLYKSVKNVFFKVLRKSFFISEEGLGPGIRHVIIQSEVKYAEVIYKFIN